MTPLSPHPPRGLHHPRLGATARQALVALAESPQGAMAAPLLLAHGFTPKLVGRLVDAGLASKTSGRMKGGVSPIHVVLIKITDAGRSALDS